MHTATIKAEYNLLQVLRMLGWMAAAIAALISSGCSNNMIRSNTEQLTSMTQVHTAKLQTSDIQVAGIAFITPSSFTGQEEDKQALALAFTEELQILRPDLRCIRLSDTLSAINRSGLTVEYRRMFEDSLLTGIFDRDTLKKIASVTGARYLAQLKLGAFSQDSRGRWGMLGVRMLDTKLSNIRLFLQIWDSEDGAIVWEGSQELTIAYESLAEETISLQKTVGISAHEIMKQFPASQLAKAESPEPKRANTDGDNVFLKPTLNAAK